MDETIALQDLTARKETSMFWLNKVNFFDPLLFFFFFFFKSPPLFFDFLFCWCVGAYIECMESTKRVRVVVFSLNISDRKPKKIETSNNQKCWLLLRCYFYNVVRLTRFVITQAGRQTWFLISGQSIFYLWHSSIRCGWPITSTCENHMAFRSCAISSLIKNFFVFVVNLKGKNAAKESRQWKSGQRKAVISAATG